jgi:hypothetical protein
MENCALALTNSVDHQLQAIWQRPKATKLSAHSRRAMTNFTAPVVELVDEDLADDDNDGPRLDLLKRSGCCWRYILVVLFFFFVDGTFLIFDDNSLPFTYLFLCAVSERTKVSCRLRNLVMILCWPRLTYSKQTGY